MFFNALKEVPVRMYNNCSGAHESQRAQLKRGRSRRHQLRGGSASGNGFRLVSRGQNTAVVAVVGVRVKQGVLKRKSSENLTGIHTVPLVECDCGVIPC